MNMYDGAGFNAFTRRYDRRALGMGEWAWAMNRREMDVEAGTTTVFFESFLLLAGQGHSLVSVRAARRCIPGTLPPVPEHLPCLVDLTPVYAGARYPLPVLGEDA